MFFWFQIVSFFSLPSHSQFFVFPIIFLLFCFSHFFSSALISSPIRISQSFCTVSHFCFLWPQSLGSPKKHQVHAQYGSREKQSHQTNRTAGARTGFLYLERRQTLFGKTVTDSTRAIMTAVGVLPLALYFFSAQASWSVWHSMSQAPTHTQY